MAMTDEERDKKIADTHTVVMQLRELIKPTDLENPGKKGLWDDVEFLKRSHSAMFDSQSSIDRRLLEQERIEGNRAAVKEEQDKLLTATASSAFHSKIGSLIAGAAAMGALLKAYFGSGSGQ